jgi:exodeoxyribonuclease V beta subunit
MDRGNGRTSFSAMTDGMHGGRTVGDGETETEAEDRDEADSDASDVGDAPVAAAARTGIFALPPGTQTGSCIHELFERLDFGDAATHGGIIAQMLKRYGLEAHRGAVERMVESVLETELPDGGGKLRDAKTWIPEMKFDFPMRRTTAATLAGVADVLDAHWAGNDPWKREFTDKLRTAEGAERAIARGYMTGAIDLVFRAGGKFHLADWKTNRLGGTAESFGDAGLRAEMKACLYPLQYLVYLTALDGILRERLAGYEYDKDIGNVYYLFVRGMDGTGRGVYVDRPGRDTIEALGNYLRGGGR